MKRLSILSLTGAICIGLSALAFGASTPKTKTLTAKMTVSLAGAPTAGACPGAGYATVAACTTTTCMCITDPAATISGGIAGKGTAIISATEFTGEQVPVVPGASTGVCDPFYVDAVISSTLKKTVQTETMSMHLVGCNALTASGKGSVSGGFGIETVPPASNAAVGWGTVTGTTKSKVATLTLKGAITQ